MVLIKCTCAWCGFTASRFTIDGSQPQVWVCDVCAAKWKETDTTALPTASE